ncbi:OmpP1/FadL family transporter [Cupriavidus basilensis]|uniref:Long-chain fatty acid transport protein n=1 Tax=Cupriavidus basilensis TaxID=68895 RepID=A0A0C4YI74_9BURK|nr:outer membrane protein transport protein [Cupriavidus basilensis]AJG22330.1 Long-chain fatty acid transport protein [Cupriavidus basilensis]
MYPRRKKVAAVSFLVLGFNLACNTARANNGSELSANGALAAGMGGVGIAIPQGATAAADNPAGMAGVGTRLDLYGVLVSARVNASFGTETNSHFSNVIQPAPGFGFNYQIDPRWTVGVSVTGAGLGTKYSSPALPIPGLADARSSLMIVRTSPTVTYKPASNVSLGASLIIGAQQFRANGVVGAGPGGPAAVPTHGDSYAGGIGAGFGVLWDLTPMVSLGASYYTKTRFSPLAGYRDDLLASSNGHLDSPSKYGVGIAVRPLSGLTIGADFLRILWSGAAGYNDPATFNWHDQNVFRIGVSYDINPSWTVRAGFSAANSFIDSDHTLANFYANGITTKSVTAGFSYNVDKANTVTFALEYDIPRTVTGTGPSTGTNISAKSQWYTIGYTHKF